MNSYLSTPTPDETETLPPKEETRPEEKQPETKKEIVVLSRLTSDPKRWADAQNIFKMHNYCRPHQSRTEQAFIKDFLMPLKGKFDKKGNYHVTVSDAPVLWSSHTDTVHTKKGMQYLEYWADQKSGDTFVGVAASDKSSCLGADDTAGVWLMIEMIKAKVPGHYVFHRGEECGGIGSKWIAENCKDWLKGFKYAIAFDRKDTASIITYQRSLRCCSDEFAESLAEQIGMKHKCDDGGMWTDTASYTDIIPECTNVSVGYENAHGRSEKLNIDYLLNLRDAMLKVDVAKFVEKRIAGSYQRKSYSYHASDYSDGWGGNYHYQKKEPGVGEYTRHELDALFGDNGWYQWFDWFHETGFWKRRKNASIPDNVYKDISTRTKKLTKKGKDLGVTKGWVQKAMDLTVADKRGEPSGIELKWLITDNHEIISDLLESCGWDGKSLRAYIEKCGGRSDYTHYIY